MSPIIFVSGHLDLTDEEFAEHYVPMLTASMERGYTFVVGDACGCDTMTQRWLRERNAVGVVFHMFDSPRNNHGFPCVGGYTNDADRDEAMTRATDADIAWVRPGREKSGTAKSLKRRIEMLEREE